MCQIGGSLTDVCAPVCVCVKWLTNLPTLLSATPLPLVPTMTPQVVVVMEDCGPEARIAEESLSPYKH